LNREIKSLDDDIDQKMQKLPEAEWAKSLPGAGPVLAPALLACVGRDAKRFASVSEARAPDGHRTGHQTKWKDQDGPFSLRMLEVRPANVASVRPMNPDASAGGRPNFTKAIEPPDMATTRHFGPWPTSGSRSSWPCNEQENPTMNGSLLTADKNIL